MASPQTRGEPLTDRGVAAALGSAAGHEPWAMDRHTTCDRHRPGVAKNHGIAAANEIAAAQEGAAARGRRQPMESPQHLRSLRPLCPLPPLPTKHTRAQVNL